MIDEDDFDDKKRLRAAENLGWLAGTGSYTKKRKLIEGVSGASVVELKAELYRAQQDAKLAREGLSDSGVKDRKQAGIDVSSILDRRNAGIEARQAADQAAHKTDKDRMNDSYAALERKAQLYDRLAAGHADDDDEQYNVDFLRKGFLVHEDRGPSRMASDGANRAIDTAGMAVSSSDMLSGDMLQEQSRRNWEEESKRRYELEQLAEEDRDRRVENMARIVEETTEGRDRAVEAKQIQQQQESQKRDRLKAAFLKKQLEAVKAAKQSKAVGKKR